MDGAKAVSRSARPTAAQTTDSGAGADAQENPATETVSLRLATVQDAPTLLAIYAPYVRETGITFEYEVPTEEEFARRITTTLERYPYLVAVDRGGAALGYAYASAFKGRAAYDWSVETSIYVDRASRGRHVGTRLLDALEALLALQGITNAEACIAYPDEGGSVGFHERRGYRMVGRFEKCAYKLGRWWDMVWMEHHIAPHTPDSTAPAPILPFPELLEGAGGAAEQTPLTARTRAQLSEILGRPSLG